MPAILTGLQVAATLAVVGAVVGDFFFRQGDAGIGVLIDLYRARLQSEQLFGAAILACLLGVVVFSAFGLLNRLVTGGWYGSTAYDGPHRARSTRGDGRGDDTGWRRWPPGCSCCSRRPACGQDAADAAGARRSPAS